MQTLKTGTNSSRPWLNAGIWLVQVMIAVPFVAIGAIKLTMPLDQVAKLAPWAIEYPRFVRLIGLIDLAGGIGLILPALTRIKPQLTVWAAVGCAALMVCAIVFHLVRGEANAIGLNIVLLGLTLIAWWGRSRAVPIRPR
ncbi:MAG: DoxX family protein [Novosphingobium sp.]